MVHFAPCMRSLCIRGDVSLMNVPTYTQPTYTRGIAECMKYDRIYQSFLTSLKTLTTAQYWRWYDLNNIKNIKLHDPRKEIGAYWSNSVIGNSTGWKWLITKNVTKHFMLLSVSPSCLAGCCPAQDLRLVSTLALALAGTFSRVLAFCITISQHRWLFFQRCLCGW
jgi:hypothetical protein